MVTCAALKTGSGIIDVFLVKAMVWFTRMIHTSIQRCMMPWVGIMSQIMVFSDFGVKNNKSS
jgi:hypothetical protein